MHSVQSLKTTFEDYLGKHPLKSSPESLYAPIEYILTQPGKRIRPVMVLLAYSLFRDDFARALPAALAIEYFHNFTLIHDDIMDAALLRRGKKSVHAKFGTNPAILSGDLMLIRSFDLLLAASMENNVHKVIGEFSDTAIQICEGQQLDMDFETRDNITVQDYLLMVEKKTAVLLGCALYIGALLADASQQEAESLNDIGVNLGKAFQIQDDVLDTYGDEQLVGKRRGGDILQKKKSILYALAWESSSQVGRNTLAELYNKDSGNPEVKIQQVLKLFDKLNVRERADNLGLNYFRSAMDALDRLDVQGEQLVVFRDFIHGMLSRTS
jgi:geranylgeranyl diphosphate synthase type II